MEGEVGGPQTKQILPMKCVCVGGGGVVKGTEKDREGEDYRETKREREIDS